MTRQPPTALYIEMRLIHAETGSIEKTAAELIRRGATPDEVRDLLYPGLRAIERRLLDAAIADAYGDSGLPAVDAPEPRAARRGPGRPGWDWLTFQAHLREAERLTSPPRTPQRIADNFALLDGTRGTTSSEYVARLRRKLSE